MFTRAFAMGARGPFFGGLVFYVMVDAALLFHTDEDTEFLDGRDDIEGRADQLIYDGIVVAAKGLQDPIGYDGVEA